MARRRLDLRFPPNRATKPVTYHLVRDYGLVTNILRAQIQPGQQGRMVLEVTGRAAEIDAAVALMSAAQDKDGYLNSHFQDCIL